MTALTPTATSDGRFTYLASGEASARPLVFLHGIGCGARLWTAQLAVFGERYRAIAWDMPGYGGSAALATPRIDDYATALAEFLAALELSAPVLVGHSVGGMIVQSYLAQGLGTPAAAVLAQTSPAFGGRDPAWAEAFVAARLGPLDAGATMRSLAADMVAGMIGDAPDPEGVALARDVMAETPEAAYRASTLSMLGFDRRTDLAGIAVPTLLIAGSRDANAPAATMAKMAERVAGAEHVCLEGVGHLAMLERPDAFNAALDGFLARHVAPIGESP